MIIKIDCKYYSGSKPCKYHKIDKRMCDECMDYIKNEKRILIIKLDALGDVLRTTCVLPALAKKYPASQITWVTKKRAVNILKKNKYIDRILSVEDNYLSILLNEEFDIGICLDAENLSASILSVANCNEKYGFVVNKQGQIIYVNDEAKNWYYLGLNDELKKKNRKTYQQYSYEICKLDGNIYKPEYNLIENSIGYAEYFKKINRFDKYEYVIGINTGGGNRWECKKWIKEYYSELIKKILDYKINIAVILFGGEKEKDVVGFIKKEFNENVFDAECYDLIIKFAEIINITDLFITPDSLGFHLSVALDKYTIVLVGPTSPWELDVYGKGEIVYNKDIDCIACYYSVCKRNKECMTLLTPDIIFEKIVKKIDEACNR